MHATRYALTAVAIVSCLFLSWLAFQAALAAARIPGMEVTIALLVALALAMALVAAGLIRRQAWAAYLLSGAAFLLLLPTAFTLLLALGSFPSPYNTSDPAFTVWGRLLILGSLLLELGVGILGLWLGRSLRRERLGRRSELLPPADLIALK